jgi:hypothetical protein
MITLQSNAEQNINLLAHHRAYQFTNKTMAHEFVRFLNWLLPYNCDNQDHVFDSITHTIDSFDTCYITLGYFHYDKSLSHATRIDLSVSEIVPHGSVIDESCFSQPLYTQLDRCLSHMSRPNRKQLINLKLAYL